MSERERFERFCREKRVHPETLQGLAIWEGWQAALSIRKTYGYGIVDKDGDYCGAFAPRGQQEALVRECDLYHSDSAPHRAVELFYEDQS